VTKAKGCKVTGQEGSRESHNILPRVWENVREWTFTPQGSSTLGVGVPVDFQIFRGRFQGSKLNGLRNSLHHWKDLGTKMSKMGLHHPFRHLKQKLGPKEGLGVKLTIWFLTTKSQESTQFFYVQVACDIPLENSQQGLQLFFRPHLHQRFSRKVMGLQSHGSPNLGNFETPTLGVPKQKAIWMWARGQPQSIL